MNTTRLFLLVALSIGWLLPATAEDTKTVKEDKALLNKEAAVRCVRLASIRNMDVLDDYHIAFEMTGNKYYLNVLPHRCGGLGRSDTIMYRTSLNELCDLDIITALDNIGGGFMQGPSCGLGRFIPIDAEELKAFKEDIKAAK